MSWFSWLRNLWKPAPSPAPRGTEPTVDYPPSPSHLIPPPRSPAFDGSTPGVLLMGVASDVGRVRQRNEDNFYVAGQIRPAHHRRVVAGYESPADQAVVLVADGMGGQLAGEEASRMAVEIIAKELTRRLGPETRDDQSVMTAIREAVAKANADILSCSHLHIEYTSMGTTIVLAVFWKARVYVAGIGDSRAYLLRGGRLEQLTKDHSLADALGDAGTISKDEVANHRFKHVLYLYLGSRDAREGPEEVRVLDVRPGDRLLLATDGLTGVVDDARLAEELGRGFDPQRTAEELVELALDNGSKDNVTCVVVHVV